MRLDLPVTPLATGQWAWPRLCGEDSIMQQATASGPAQKLLPPQLVVNGLPAYAGCSSTALMPIPSVPSASAVSSKHRPKRELGAYRSVDENGRVWGVPNMGGRGQCFDCCNRALPNNRRCASCLQALAEAVHEQMSSEHFAELQGSCGTALEELSGQPAYKDTADGLQQLYTQLQDGQISPAIQSQLLVIARGISTNDLAVASRAVETLSTQHWEQHKDWLKGMKRLIPAPQLRR